MNSNEEFKTKFIYDVSRTLNLNFDEQKKITDILSVILVDYEINKKVTDLAVSDITEKIVMFLQAKKIEGMSANTIENYFYTLRKLSIYFNFFLFQVIYYFTRPIITYNSMLVNR